MNFKTYLVFTGLTYYADGGWQDFKDSFETREEAKKFTEKRVSCSINTPHGEYDDWGQVVFTGDDIDDLGEEPVIEYYKKTYTQLGEWKGEWSDEPN